MFQSSPTGTQGALCRSDGKNEEPEDGDKSCEILFHRHDIVAIHMNSHHCGAQHLRRTDANLSSSKECGELRSPLGVKICSLHMDDPHLCMHGKN